MTLMDTLHELNESATESAIQHHPQRGGLGESSLEVECYKLADLIRAEDQRRQFTIKYVGQAFQRTVQWVRWAETNGLFAEPDGRKIYPNRSIPPHAISGFRMYTFTKMADMAVAIYRKNGLNKKSADKNLERFWSVLSNIRNHQLQDARTIESFDQVSA